MNKLLFLLCVVVAGSMFYSCEKDNLEGPDAIFAGELRDRKTGELIQQEISDGSRVYFIEQGWGDNPPVQNMVVKKDGTFYNGMIFSGDYKIILNRGNYVPLDTLDMKIKPGKNYQVFEVNPYLRIIEPEISVIGRKVMAKNVHEVWSQSRLSEGWTYGARRDDEEKTHPCLVPYEELPEIEKDYDRNTAIGTLKLIQALGFDIVKKR